jgi:hypothetical protein
MDWLLHASGMRVNAAHEPGAGEHLDKLAELPQQGFLKACRSHRFMIG